MIGKAGTLVAVATPLLVTHYLGRRGGYVAFGGAALLLLAGATRAHLRGRDAYDTDTGVRAYDERPPRRVPGWAWMCVCGVAGMGLLVWALGVWVTGIVGAVCVAAVIYYRYHRPLAAEAIVTPLSTPVDHRRWLAELPDRVADAVDAARLVRGHADAIGAYVTDTDEETAGPDLLARLATLLRAPETTPAGERVQLLGTPKPVGECGATFLLDLDPAAVLPEDVMRTEKTWRRHLGADTVAWEPINTRTLRVHAYLDHPLARPVDWRDLTPVQGVMDQAPMGVTAVHGRQATFWWRGSQLLVGATNSGKTVTLRAMLRGLVVQEVPVRVTLADNKGDFVDWSTAEGLGGYARGHGDCVDLVTLFVDRMDHRYLDRGSWPDGYALVPTPWQPLEVLIVGELLPLLNDGTQAQRQAAARGIGRVATTGREAACAVWGAAQTATKEQSVELGKVRDLFPGRIVFRVPNASMVAPALGVGVDRGAAAHLIPLALEGVGYHLDPSTGWPVMFRSAFVSRADQAHLTAQLGLAHCVPDRGETT